MERFNVIRVSLSHTLLRIPSLAHGGHVCAHKFDEILCEYVFQAMQMTSAGAAR